MVCRCPCSFISLCSSGNETLTLVLIEHQEYYDNYDYQDNDNTNITTDVTGTFFHTFSITKLGAYRDSKLTASVQASHFLPFSASPFGRATKCRKYVQPFRIPTASRAVGSLRHPSKNPLIADFYSGCLSGFEPGLEVPQTSVLTITP